MHISFFLHVKNDSNKLSTILKIHIEKHEFNAKQHKHLKIYGWDQVLRTSEHPLLTSLTRRVHLVTIRHGMSKSRKVL